MAADEKKTSVKAEVIQPGGPSIPMAYRMRIKNNAWKVYDIKIDGISLVTTYRSSYSQAVQNKGLDALIVTGANVANPSLEQEPFWEPLMEVVDWARNHVASTLCSCLATHAVLQFRYGQRRYALPGGKRWGVFPHRVVNRSHPLVNDVNTDFQRLTVRSWQETFDHVEQVTDPNGQGNDLQ